MNISRTHKRAGVAGIRCVILQVARQAKVRHFAHQVAVDKDVPRSQVPMDVVHFREIFHPSWDPTHHHHQLDHRELTIILLLVREKNKQYYYLTSIFHNGIFKGNLVTARQRKKSSQQWRADMKKRVSEAQIQNSRYWLLWTQKNLLYYMSRKPASTSWK